MSDLPTIDFSSVVDRYGKNKEYEKSLKSELANDNALLKSVLSQSNWGPEYATDSFVVKYSVSKSEKFNEEALLETIKSKWAEAFGSMACDLIQTREYVDMDRLESAIYNGELSSDFIKAIAECKVVTSTERINVKRRK